LSWEKVVEIFEESWQELIEEYHDARIVSTFARKLTLNYILHISFLASCLL